jgi:phosphoribosylamine-glycine ligase
MDFGRKVSRNEMRLACDQARLIWYLGRPFRGMLFTGIMMTANGPRVLEYNARFGDPETQTMVMLMAPDCDLAAILLACCTEKLDQVSVPVLPGFACNVVVAASGYPGSFARGDIIALAPCPKGKLFLGLLYQFMV